MFKCSNNRKLNYLYFILQNKSSVIQVHKHNMHASAVVKQIVVFLGFRHTSILAPNTVKSVYNDPKIVAIVDWWSLLMLINFENVTQRSGRYLKVVLTSFLTVLW